MIYMWFTGINYYKLAVEKDRERPLRPYGNQALLSCHTLCMQGDWLATLLYWIIGIWQSNLSNCIQFVSNLL